MKKQFGKFTAELEPCPDGREGNNCYVCFGGKCSSLEWVSDFGEIDGGPTVSQSTIDKIEDWASNNGW